MFSNRRKLGRWVLHFLQRTRVHRHFTAIPQTTAQSHHHNDKFPARVSMMWTNSLPTTTVSCIDRPLTQDYPKGLLVRSNELQQLAVDARLPKGSSGPDKCLYLKLLVQLFVCLVNVVISTSTMPTLVVSGGSKVGSKRNKVICFCYDDVVRGETLFILLC